MTEEELKGIEIICEKQSFLRGPSLKDYMDYEGAADIWNAAYTAGFLSETKKIQSLLDHIKTLNDVIASQKVLLDGDMEQSKVLNGVIRDLQSQIPRWIPVSEKLPEDNQEVLFGVFDPVTQIYNGYVRNGKVLSDIFEESKEICPWLYWMPLPKGPEESCS